MAVHQAPRKSPPEVSIRIAVLGDCQLFCDGLRAVLATDPALRLVGEEGGDTGGIRSVVQQAHPDLLLAHSGVAGILTLCRELWQAGPRPWVLLVAADGDVDWTVRAIEAGARGILGRTAPAAELLRAVRAVHAGQLWVPHVAVTRLVESLVALLGVTDPQLALLAQRLSAREREVVQHVADGLSNQEIGDRLGISEATVKAHLTHIFQKLEVRDRAQLVARYHRAVHHGAPVSARLTT